jgi:hypothetical protein
MAGQSLPNLPQATGVGPTALIWVNQNGIDQRAQASQVASSAPELFMFPPLSSAPSNPVAGLAYFDTTLGYPLIYDGTAWRGFLINA